MNVRSLCTLTVVALLLACGDTPSTSVSPSNGANAPSGTGTAVITSDRLSGTWNLVSIQPAGAPEQPVPTAATYTLTLADGRLSTRADCNMCGGSFTLTETTLIASPNMACTRAACPTMAYESAYTRILAGDSAVAVAGNVLTLTSARGSLRFSR